MTGRFTEHHAFLARVHLDLIDQRSHAIAELSTRIEVVIEPFRGARDLIVSIPGISVLVADVIIAETSADMSRFPTAGHLASWAGRCPAATSRPDQVDQAPTRQPLPQRRPEFPRTINSQKSSRWWTRLW